MKIDEVNNLGAARIRIRSLISAVKDRERKGIEPHLADSAHHRVVFTEEMRKNYTILAPQMSPIHFDILMPALSACGYNLVQLPSGVGELDYGLKYVNNDACYPSLLVVGQFMKALLSGEYDLDKTAVIITQTGGGCRATNYIGFIRRALEKSRHGTDPCYLVECRSRKESRIQDQLPPVESSDPLSDLWRSVHAGCISYTPL